MTTMESPEIASCDPQVDTSYTGQIATLRERVAALEAENARLKEWRVLDNDAAVECLTEERMKRERAEAERDDAVSILRAMNEEMVIAGYSRGDRNVTLANVRMMRVDLNTTQAERDALRADAELLMLDLSSAWFYGNWKAETYTEREMQEIMERQGYWPTSEPELVTRRVAIDAARKEKP